MPKLSDSQLVVLSTACQRPDGCVYPLTLKLNGNAVGKVLKSLLAKGYLEEIPGRADDTVWRHEDGAPLTLKASRAAYRELGIEPDAEDAGKGAVDTAARAPRKPKSRAAKERASRKDTKQAMVIAMLRRAKGASIEQIGEATGWQQHTVRGFLAGTLKKRLGLDVSSEKSEGRARVYRMAK